MIRNFVHKGLRDLFENRRSAKVRPDLQARCLARLDMIEQAVVLDDMNLPGCRFHSLRGEPRRWTVHVNGPWCITFEFIDGDAWRVDLENYH